MTYNERQDAPEEVWADGDFRMAASRAQQTRDKRQKKRARGATIAVIGITIFFEIASSAAGASFYDEMFHLCLSNGLCTLKGTVTVTGAETLHFEKYSVKLSGIDTDQLNGRQEWAAMAALTRLTQGKIVECEIHKYITASRDVFYGRCFLDGDIDIAAEMVSGGYALNCRYTGGGYLLLEPENARNRLPQSPYC